MNFSLRRARPAFVLSVALALLAFPGPARAAPELPPAGEAARLYSGKLDAFRERTTAFRTGLETLPDNASGTRALRRQTGDLRDAFKDIEFLAEYLNADAAVRLNGAPLDRADLEYPGTPAVLKPEGLQVLMAAAGEDRPLRDRAELSALALNLEIAAWSLSFSALDDRQVFEAMEQQVIRAMTKGITGFDVSPDRSLPETRRSLEALKPALRLYLPALRRLDAGKGRELSKRLPAALDKAIGALRGDFDSFDRLAFIRDAGDPLYASLIDAHEALGIFHTADLTYLGRPLFAPVNPLSRNLFDPAFLNVHAYSRHPREKPDSAIEALGHRLFFDPVLSSDGKRSCASCHDPRLAFSDGLPKSPGFGGVGTQARNTPGLSHAAWQRNQFWDLREKNLDEQALHVVLGEREFHSNVSALLDAMDADPAYPALFRTAYPRDPSPVNVANLTQALSMYLRSLPTGRTAFDRYARGETAFIDPATRRGFNLFMGKALCATCHFAPVFNGTVPPTYRETEGEVLGVPEKFPAPVLVLDPDLGRYEIYNAANLRHAFKTPGLRNAELTAPYMHNGAFATLEDVLDFYNAGGGRGLGLDVPNQTLPPDSLGLSRQDMDDIITFIKSLTDTAGFGAQGKPAGY